MASSIKSIVDKYKQNIIEQNDWSITSQLKKQQTVASKKTGSLFLSMIVGILLDDYEVSFSSQKQLQKQKNKMLQSLKNKYKSEGEVLQRIFGMFITQFIREDDKLSKLYMEFDSIFQPDQFSQDSIGLNSQDEDNETSIYSLNSQMSKLSSINMQNNYNKMLEEQSIIHFIDQNVQNNKTHQYIVYEYITKLSAPQTELTYLCQHFGWRGAFKDSQLPNGSFQVTAAVDFQFKNFKKDLIAKAEYKNKKVARMLSAAKLLRSLYISFPQVWTIYSKIRNDKSLIIPQDQGTSLLLKKVIKEEKVEIVNAGPSKKKEQDLQRQLYQYLGQILSFKSQLNILLQQITGVFTHPKMQKIAFEGKWKVKGQLFMINQSTGENKHYVEVQISANSKQAQQIVAKKILSKMYLQNRDILQIMIVLKKKKGFKT